MGIKGRSRCGICRSCARGIGYDGEILNAWGYGGEEFLGGKLAELALACPMAYEPGETWN
jgi:hypothetical protein